MAAVVESRKQVGKLVPPLELDQWFSQGKIDEADYHNLLWAQGMIAGNTVDPDAPVLTPPPKNGRLKGGIVTPKLTGHPLDEE